MRSKKQIITQSGLYVIQGYRYVTNKGSKHQSTVEVTSIYNKYFGEVKDIKTGIKYDIMFNFLSSIY